MLCGALPLRHSPKRRASLRLALRCAGLSCFLWSPCFAGYKQRNSALVQRKDPLLTSALVQKARVAAEASLKGVGEPPAAPCSAALCGRVPPWSNNYPQQPLDVVTAITLRLSVVVDHTGRALRTKALPLPATFRLYSEFGGYQKAASPRAQALGPCASVWRAPPCNGVSTLSTQH